MQRPDKEATAFLIEYISIQKHVYCFILKGDSF